jgi:glutamate carboxypeptidase
MPDLNVDMQDLNRFLSALPASDIQAYLDSCQSEMVDFVRRLALIESPSLVPDSQQAALELLKESLMELDFAVRLIPGRSSGGHLYASPHRRRNHGRPVQLLLGHCDTVWPLGTLRQMPVVIKDGRLKGPGVYDMKAGLTQAVFALRALKDLALVPDANPVVFINSDEEIGSLESTRYIRRLARVAARAFVMEPSLGFTGNLKTTRKGVGSFKVSVEGKAAHAGLNPEGGASAILELSHQIQQLFSLNDPQQGVTVNVGRIDGGLQANVIAPHSEALIDVRVPTQADADRILLAIQGLKPVTPGVTLKIEGSFRRPPLEPTPRNRALWNIAKMLAAQIRLDLGEGSAGGGSDGNTASQHTATLDGLGAVGDGAHAVHEFIYPDRLAERATLLATLLLAPVDATQRLN